MCVVDALPLVMAYVYRDTSLCGSGCRWTRLSIDVVHYGTAVLTGYNTRVHHREHVPERG